MELQEIIERYQNYKVYTYKELLEIPDNAVFEHMTLGRCIVKNKHMIFRNKEIRSVKLKRGGYPLDLPMKRLYYDSNDMPCG